MGNSNFLIVKSVTINWIWTFLVVYASIKKDYDKSLAMKWHLFSCAWRTYLSEQGSCTFSCEANEFWYMFILQMN